MRIGACALLASILAGGEPEVPPSLPQVPEGFKVELIHQAPDLLYPSAVACAPDGSLFVAEDPMDMPGPSNQPLDRIWLYRWDDQGHVAGRTVFAEKLNAVFGLQWIDGWLYVMHMPMLSRFRDSDGDGVADVREDLITDLGQKPGAFGFNDHIVSGIRLAMDGYIYISVGDKGIPHATGQDGRQIQLQGGGVVRVRPDGSGLEVVATGTRNHLEVHMDAEDHIFTYDNTDDGLGWWTRFTHIIDSGYYGYPYDYHGRQDKMLPRMAEYGGGSPTGGAIYLDDAWPEEFRGNAFSCEWGKGLLRRFELERDGATFRVRNVSEFMKPEGVPNFRPLDVCFSADGRCLYLADWGYSGWLQNQEAGRLFRVSWAGTSSAAPRGSDADPLDAQLRSLGHPAFTERLRAQRALARRGENAVQPLAKLLAGATAPLAKRHAIWALDAIGGTAAQQVLRDLVRQPGDADSGVRAQAIRALGMRGVYAAPGVAPDPSAVVRLEQAIALGRAEGAARDGAAELLFRLLGDEELPVRHAAMRALKRLGDWQHAARALQSPAAAVRDGALLAFEDVYDEAAVHELAAAAEGTQEPPYRARAVTALAAVERRAKPWDGSWWGTQPARGAPAPRTVEWSGTARIRAAVRERLGDVAAEVRRSAVVAVRDTEDRPALARLRERFPHEPDAAVRRAMVEAFGSLQDGDSVPLLAGVIRDAAADESLRGAAVAAAERIGSPPAIDALTRVVSDAGVPAELLPPAIEALGHLKIRAALPLVEQQLRHADAAVRHAAVGALARIAGPDAAEPLVGVLHDRDVAVRRAAITELGKLKVKQALVPLLDAAQHTDTRFESLLALTALDDPAALGAYLEALGDKSPDLRNAGGRAIRAIQDQARPVVDELARRGEIRPGVLAELQTIYAGFQPITHWRVVGPFPNRPDRSYPPETETGLDTARSYEGFPGVSVGWRDVPADDVTGMVQLDTLLRPNQDTVCYGVSEYEAAEDGAVQAWVGSDDTITIWVGGQEVHEHLGDRGWAEHQDKVLLPLRQGANEIRIKCGNHSGPWQFSLQMARKGSGPLFEQGIAKKLNIDEFRDAAMSGNGDSERGQKMFSDAKGIGCIKCHAVGGVGGQVGPDLAGVAAKYARDELITSLLEPSQRIAQGYETILVATNDGPVLSGVFKGETSDSVELADAEGNRHKIPKSDIEERKFSQLSTMPNGLADGMTLVDFRDIVAFLETLRETPGDRAASGGK